MYARHLCYVVILWVENHSASHKTCGHIHLTRASREEALSSHQAYVKIDYQARQGSQAFNLVRLAIYWKPSRPQGLAGRL